MDGPGIAGGLRAGACDLPYGLVPDLGTDLPRVNPEGYRRARVQDGGRPLLEVPAIKPDVVFLHGQQADEDGNVQYFGASYFDLLMAQAAKHVICLVDRIVPSSTVRQSARLTKNSVRLRRCRRGVAVRRTSGRQLGPLRAGRGASGRLCGGEPRPGVVRCLSGQPCPRCRGRGRLSRAHRRTGTGAVVVRGVVSSGAFHARVVRFFAAGCSMRDI